jgi:predicted ribosomally synthesized peptide with SipW-like signal peptide
MKIRNRIQMISWLMIIIGVIFGLTGLTSAYFSDQENSEVSFNSGTIELEALQATSTLAFPLEACNLIPYQENSSFFKVKNIGTLPFNWTMKFQAASSSQQLSEILQIEVLIENNLLDYLRQAQQANSETDYNQALDKFIERVAFLKDQAVLSENIAQDLISKALTLKTN